MRGWRREQVAQTTDTAGQPNEVTTRLTRSPHGKTVVGIAIETGPSAILRIDGHVSTGGQLIANVHAALADLLEHGGGV